MSVETPRGDSPPVPGRGTPATPLPRVDGGVLLPDGAVVPEDELDAGAPGDPADPPVTVPPVVPPPEQYSCSEEVEVTPGDDLSSIVASAGPGVCVLVRQGTYAISRSLVPPSGTSDAPVVVQSADGPLAAIVDASGVNGPALLFQATHVIVDGFDFVNMPTGSGNQTVVVRGDGAGLGEGTVLRNSRVTGGHNHLKINQAAMGVTIENNEFFGTFGHIPISITGVIGLSLRGNHFHDWTTGGNGAIQIKGGSRDVVVEGNLVENVDGLGGAITLGDGCGSTCDIDPEHYAGRRLTAVNNVLINVGRGFDSYGCIDCAFLHNTVIDSAESTVAIKLGSTSTGGTTRSSRNVTFVNNAIVHRQGDLSAIMQINDDAGNGLEVGHNLFWNNGDGVNVGDYPGDAPGSVEGDPRFAGSGFEPSADSPLVDAGDPRNVARDYSGADRDTSPDIGAFEFQ